MPTQYRLEANINGQRVTVTLNQLYRNHEKFVVLETEVPPSKEHSHREMASVTVRYKNMKSQAFEKLKTSTIVTFSKSAELIRKQTDKKVTADVVELIATVRNELAMHLRDKGKIEEAKQVFHENISYLKENSSRLNSQKLADYATLNDVDMKNLDDLNWTKHRKLMIERQHDYHTQSTPKNYHSTKGQEIQQEEKKDKND